MTDVCLKAKQQRILAVRKQEAILARQSSKDFRSNKNLSTNLQNLVTNIQEKSKQEIEAEIENLLKQKDYCLKNLGKAQKQAEEERRIIEEEIRAKEIFLQNAKIKAKERGIQAVRVHQENEAKRISEENALKEKRAEILKLESEIAHDLAKKYREKQEIVEKLRKEEEIQNFVRPGGVVVYGTIDYKTTHFHNPVILKHDYSGKTAEELANDEQEAALLRLQQKEEEKALHSQKAANRGDEALLKITVDKELARLTQELEKIRKADGNKKIEKAKKDPVLPNRCIVKDSQDKEKKQKNMNRMFEEMTFFSNLTNSPDKKMTWDSPKTSKIEVLEIPQPQTENFVVEKPKKIPEEIKIQVKNVESSKKSEESNEEELLLSESDESSEKAQLEAKYLPKNKKSIKEKSKKPTKKSKKDKKTKKFSQNLEIQEGTLLPSSKNFGLEWTDEFKDVLEDDYIKHLETKKKLEELKKFDEKSEKNEEKNNKKQQKTIKNADSKGPPSVISSQISPKSPEFIKNEDIYHNFEKTSEFPETTANNENFLDFYSKVKTNFSKNSEKPQTKLPKNYDSHQSEDLENKSLTFLDEMKIKYGIVSKPVNQEKNSEKNEKIMKNNEKDSKIYEKDPKNYEKDSKNFEKNSKTYEKEESLSSKSLEDENLSFELKKDPSEQIFSERTLKLMKEIEEKYSLKKFDENEYEEF